MDADEVVMLKQDGSNYQIWSHLMSQHMIQTRRQLWDYVCGIVTEPNPGHENFTNLSQQWKTKNAEILNMICIYVLNPSVSIQLRSFKSGKESWDYLAELYGHSNWRLRLEQLETQIRATKQGDRTIKEFHGVMVGLWNQQAKLEDRDLSLLSSYKKNRDEQRLVQFLIALRDEFEPIRRSILCRLFLPSVEKAVRELEEEEIRLKPSIVSEFDQSHKFNKPSLSRDRSAMSSSSSMTETYDWRSLLGGLAKVAIASYAAVQVSRTLYNYYTEPVAVESFSGTGSTSRTLKILSYNVCFREDLEIHKRMKAVGGLIQLHSPDLICFQEVTLKIYDIFQQSSWWNLYHCSVSNVMEYKSRSFCMQLSKLPVKSYHSIPLRNSTMERKLCVAKFEVQADMPLVVATSHLKGPGPGPGDQKFSKERVDQAKEALAFLKKKVNVIFCGDMNWDDDLDGQFPLPNGWVDAWVQLKPGENGWTYDTKSNKMLYGDWPVQKRLDRFVCNLRDFKLRRIERIGMEAIPGLSYCKEKKEKNKVHMMLPVFPSDHYGLLLTICAK
ncbi:uncharacterized protein LOC114263978 isoform X1 [Camellia sinensis]|uniref:uncharacterized protein LOC114263978 isoform X1 n=1 Tax=Camellia sinensis TaxID=4442 RepID=UPI0010361FE7|nr:uncharacterized protein LOC114263978 isoform X1 [Camellia sinensis]